MSIALLEEVRDKQYYICRLHQNYCSMSCSHPDCYFQPLCELCIGIHPSAHSKYITSLDKLIHQSKGIPTALSHKLHNMKGSLFSLQMSVNNKKEDVEKELKFFMIELRQSFNNLVEKFEAKFHEKLDDYFLKFTKKVKDTLEDVNKQISTMDPNSSSAYISNEKVQQLLSIQRQLQDKYIPTFERKIREMDHEINSSNIFFNKALILGKISTFFTTDVLSSPDIFSYTQVTTNTNKTCCGGKSSKNRGQSLSHSTILENTSRNILCNSNYYTVDQINTNAKSTISRAPLKINQRDDGYRNYYVKDDVNLFKKLEIPLIKKEVDIIQTVGVHDDIINAVLVVPLSNLILSGGGDKKILVWDLENRILRTTLIGHTADIWALCNLNDKYLIASGSSDRTIRIWDIRENNLVKTLTGHLDVVRCLAYSRRNKVLLSGGADNMIKVWDVYAGVCLTSVAAHSNIVKAIVCMENKNQFASSSSDGLIKIWDLKKIIDNTENIGIYSIHVLKGHVGEVCCVCYLEDQNKLASAGFDRMIRIWNCNVWDVDCVLKGHEEMICAMVYLGDGRRLFTGGVDKTIRLWNIESRVNIRTFREHDEMITSIALANRNLITGSWDRKLKLWTVMM